VNQDKRRGAWSRAARARPPTSHHAALPTDAGLSLPCTRVALSLLSPETGLPGLSRQGRGAIAARSSARRPRGSGRASASAVLRQRAAHLVEHPLPAAAAACRPRRATRPRRGACRCKTRNCAPRPTAGGVGGPRPGRACGATRRARDGLAHTVRRPGRDGPQPARRASPRARPACAPATARQPVPRLPRPSLRARQGRPRRG
jgi:hypothetical protein